MRDAQSSQGPARGGDSSRLSTDLSARSRPICPSSLQVAANEASYYSLMDVNLRIWRLEEAVRAKERARKFDEEFIQ